MDKDCNLLKKYCYVMGPTGPTGPRGNIERLPSSYLVTFNTKDEGVEIENGTSLKIDRKELDDTNLISLDNTNNTIKFNKIGYYKVSFIASVSITKDNVDFNPNTDFVTLGFRQKDTDLIYIGASKWLDNIGSQLTGHGIIRVVDTNTLYELANLSNKTIYLKAPSISNITSASYFTNSLLTIIIDYLGV